MGDPEELKPVLESMRRNWDARAAENAQFYVFTESRSEDFEESGRVNYEQIVRPFLPVLLRGRSPRDCRVVEIGCGLGRMTACFAKEFREVHGIDVSAEMLAKARERLHGLQNVFLHAGSGMDLSGLPDSYFDLAFSYLVFQHIPSRDVIGNYVREAARVLKSGGAFHFQLNGYQRREYQEREKDTWLGESFSFSEAAQMLAEAGFRPLNATGAGTQYFVLSARRAGEADRVLSPFILPGPAWPHEQLIEGWPREIPGDCRPVKSRARALLGIPSGRPLRLFLSLHCGPVEFYPAVAIDLEGCFLGREEIKGPGSHYWEFAIPSDLRGSQAMVTLNIEPPARATTVSVRSLGIFVPEESETGAHPEGGFSRTQIEMGERIFWGANLETECTRLSGIIAHLQAEIAQRAAQARSIEEEIASRTAWARSLEEDIASKVAWARSLESDVEQARAALARLQVEFEDRTKWALSLDSELRATRSLLRECTERAGELDAELRLACTKPWRFFGRRLRSKLRSRWRRG